MKLRFKGILCMAVVISFMLCAGCGFGSTVETEVDDAQQRIDANAMTNFSLDEMYCENDMFCYHEYQSDVVYTIDRGGKVSKEKYAEQPDEELSKIKAADGFPFSDDQYISQEHSGKYYFTDLKDLYVYENGAFRKAADLESTELNYISFDPGFYYLAEPYFYYNANHDNEVYLYRYDLDKSEILDKVKVRDVNPVNGEALDMLMNMTAVDNTVYYLDFDSTADGSVITSDSRICRTNLSTKKTEELFKSSGAVSFQYYKGYLYFSVADNNGSGIDDTGIYKMDIKNTDSIEKLYDGEFYGFAIFDDEYIYITGFENEKLVVSRLDTADKSVKKLLTFDKLI